MASPSPNPREGEEGGSEFAEETSRERAPAPQKTYVAPPASQLPTKLHYVSLAPGPSGIKQCFRTVKSARRVPTLPRKDPSPKEAEASAGEPSAEPVPRPRRDRTKRHLCTTCDKRFSSPGKLSQHILSHTGELPFACELCDKSFNSRFKLARHSLIHSEARAFACSVCGRTFNRKDHLTNHVRIHNPVKKLYTCEKPDCKKSYTSQLTYRKHAALHSAEAGNLQCQICDESFNTQQDIIHHLKFHTGSRTIKNETDKKFTCQYCDRRFFTAKDVRRHQVVHTGRRDFLCPFCPQKFGRKDHLVRHVKNAHPDESWKSAAVGTSSEPIPGTSSFEESFPDFSLDGSDLKIDWKTTVKSATMSEGGRTRVPSSDIIEELPCDLDIKVEPLDPNIDDSKSPQSQLHLQFPERTFISVKDDQSSEISHSREFLCRYCPVQFDSRDLLIRHLKGVHPEASHECDDSTAFDTSFPDFSLHTEFTIDWKEEPKEGIAESGRTRVPSSDIIVEMPSDLDIKVEPLEIELDEPTSPSCALPYTVYMVPPSFQSTQPSLPYMTTQPMAETLIAHVLDPTNVETMLLDPGEGTSGMPGHVLELLDDSTFASEEGRQQRLPAFTQAFQTPPTPKPPQPPPPPH